MARIMVVGSRYGMTEEEKKRLDLYISTLKKLDVWKGCFLPSDHTFDYNYFHKVFFPEFHQCDEIQIFCRRNDPKNFYFLAGIICGQTRVPVKVLEEFSDTNAGLYEKLKAREGMNREFEEMQSYFSRKKYLGCALWAVCIIPFLLLGVFLFVEQLTLAGMSFLLFALLVLVWILILALNEAYFSKTKKNVEDKYS